MSANITVGIATIPEREAQFRQVIASLHSQVDRIIAVLNNYTCPPDWVTKFPKMETIISDNCRGDAAKFLLVNTISDGIYLSCDDDISYPPGYVEYLSSKISQYSCVVTLHGKRYDNRPIHNWRRDFTLNLRCLGGVTKDTEIHVPGSGVMAFDVRDLRLSIDDFPHPNMADIWAAKAAAEQGIKIMCLAHRADYLRYLNPPGSTIWHKDNEYLYRTSVLNSFLK